MTGTHGSEPQRIGGRCFTNTGDYVRAFLSAVRAHQKLTGASELRIQIDPEGELPLAQRLLLR